MRYQGSEAYSLDRTEQQRERVQERPRFSVVEGGGLDAQARRGVGIDFLARVRVLVCVAVVLVALGAARVALCSATVSCLSQNMALRSEINDAEATVGDLKVERAQLSSSARIDRIATQNYGMVRATESDHIDISASDDAESAQDQASDASTTSSADKEQEQASQEGSADDAQASDGAATASHEG